jgi:phosphate transport system substrate-binding protein
MKLKSKFLTATAATSMMLASFSANAGHPEYERVSGVSGNLNSIGSNTLTVVLQMLAEGFQNMYPNVNIQIQGAGSGTAPAALTDGTAQIGPMSREIRQAEIDAFRERFGYEPTQVAIGIDALAVFVHRDNPVEGLSLPQIDAIFSSTNRLGHNPIRTWGEAGLTGDWSNRRISVYGRNSVSGTYGVFRRIALGGGDFDGARYQEMPGSSAVVQAIGQDRFSIGYSGVGYLTPGTRAIKVGQSADALFAPTAENAATGDYPLARLLFVYVNKRPGEPLDTLTAEFLRYALSAEGQATVERAGFFGLPSEFATTQREQF